MGQFLEDQKKLEEATSQKTTRTQQALSKNNELESEFIIPQFETLKFCLKFFKYDDQPITFWKFRNALINEVSYYSANSYKIKGAYLFEVLELAHNDIRGTITKDAVLDCLKKKYNCEFPNDLSQVPNEQLDLSEETKEKLRNIQVENDELSYMATHSKYYYCSAMVKLLVKDVTKAVYDYFLENNVESATLNDLYSYLSQHFNVNSFNKRNLSTLLNINHHLSLNKAKALYIQTNILNEDADLDEVYKDKKEQTQPKIKIVKPKEKELAESESYYCTKLVRFPIKDVVTAIYEHFIELSATSLDFYEVYKFLSDKFHVSSFNKINLMNLLQTKKIVPITTVRDLNLKYHLDEEKDLYDLRIIECMFTDNRTIIKNCIKTLGLEFIVSLVENGAFPILNACNQIVLYFDENANILELKNKKRDKVLDKYNSKAFVEFVSKYSEDELLSVLEDEQKTKDCIAEFVKEKQLEEEKIVFKKQIVGLLDFVDQDNRPAKTYYLFNSPVDEILNKYKIYTINDLANITKGQAIDLYQYKDYIIKILKRLQQSLPAYLNEKFKHVIMMVNSDYKPYSQWEKSAAMLEKRADGFNLQETANMFGVTREAIRQLDKRYFTRFSNFYNSGKGSLTPLIRAFLDNQNLITNEDLAKIFPFNPKLFKYLLKNTQTEEIAYIEEIDKFYFIEDDWYKDLVLYADTIPTEIPLQEVPKYVKDALTKIDNNKIQLSESDCEKIIMQDYKQLGSLCAKSKTTLTERFKKIMEAHFNGPVNIYDTEFLAQFRKYYDEMYDDGKTKSDHAISSILAKIGMLVGKGRYILNDRQFMSKALAEKIYTYIKESGREIFLTNNLYSIFEKELLQEGIDSKYFLQGALRQQMADKLYFSRDYVSINKDVTNVYSEILKFVKNEGRVVTYKEIQEAFVGTPWNVLMFALSQDEIINLRAKFISMDALNLNEGDKTYLKNTVETMVADGEIHSSSDLLTYIKLTNKKLLEKLQVYDQFAIFSVVNALFENDFEFRRPFIAKKGIEIGKQAERLKEFVYSQDELEISELMDFIYDNKLHIQSICDYIDSLEDYVFKNENEIFTIEKSHINKYNTEFAENIVLKSMGNEDFVFADNLKIYGILPKEVEWTPWLLYSAINKFGNNLKAIPSNTKFKQKNIMYARPLIIKKNIPANNINEFIEYLKNKLSTNETEFYKYLKIKGLV